MINSFWKKSAKYLFSILYICIAVGQGIYFATQAAVSYGYTQPDAQGLRHMFMGEHAKFDLPVWRTDLSSFQLVYWSVKQLEEIDRRVFVLPVTIRQVEKVFLSPITMLKHMHNTWLSLDDTSFSSSSVYFYIFLLM